MVERNCTLPFCFYCLTDDVYDLPDQVVGIQLDLSLDLESYWWKMSMFNLDWDQPTMYFDLDIVIQNNFNHVFNQIVDNKILLLFPDDAGINRTYDHKFKFDAKVNTSVIAFIPNQHNNIFKDFKKHIDHNIIKYIGIDRLITDKFLSQCIPIDFEKDYYFRWKDDRTPSRYVNSFGLAHDPNKTFCIISQADPVMYEGLEEYFL